MTRRRISPTERARIFEREEGFCHLCDGKIHVGQAWEISHAIPLELGGPDEGTNLRIAHRVCHRAQTSTKDVPAIARAKRRQRAHIGIRKSRRPWPCGRGSKWKRKISGEVVRR